MLLSLLFAVTFLAAMTFAENHYRLPTTLTPQHYWVKLRPTFESEDFLTTGDVKVLIFCVNRTNEIQFNVNGIDIDRSSVNLQTHDEKSIEIISQDWNEESQKYTLKVGLDLEPQEKYLLSMNFSYKLNENLEGFYRSSYKDSSGKTRWLATTQFSPINARRAFPCWDEPGFKAIFNFTLGRHSSMTSLSNMQVFLTTPMSDKEGWVWDHYESTLPMSTYLLAFIVTDLPSRDLQNTSHPHFKVWSRAEILDEMNYMSELSPKVLSFIADYFSIPFPLEKIDLFAVPDFGFSAMENWGLITFAEAAVKNSKTIAHELAHQWFGNLVTPQWWDDLWLKEGFATFIGVTALTGIEKSPEAVDKWITTELHHSLFEDSLNATHPVSNPVADPRMIWQAFDAISYEKGSAVIRMMCDFLGEKQFRAGLNVYLKEYAYGNARREQLWEAFRNLTDVDLSTVMDLWTTQPGYPVLNFTTDNEKPKIVSISQERFLLNGGHDNHSFWHIPYTYTFKSSNDKNGELTWLRDMRDMVFFESVPNGDWILLNLDQSGFYRVNYDLENWNLLIDDFANLPRRSQMQLINDAFNLAIPQRVPYSIPFRMVEKIIDSTDQLLWNVTINELKNILYFTTGTELSAQVKNYALTLFHSGDLTYSSENLVFVNFASYLGQEKLVNESVAALQEMMNGRNLSYSKEVLSSVYCNGVKHSGQDVWDFIWSKYQKEVEPEEKKRLIEGLACSQSEQNLKRLLDALMSDDSGVRKQEAKLVFSVVSQNEKGADLALNFLSDNWKRIKERFGLGYKIMSSMVLSLGPVLNKPGQYEKFEKIYKDNMDDLGSTSNAFLNSLERIQINLKWLKEHYDTVLDYVNKIIK